MSRSKTFFILWCVFTTLWIGAADFNLSTEISPNQPIAGERAKFTITFQGSENLEVPEDLPEVEGIRWVHQTGQSTKMYNINGKLTILKSMDLGFVPDREGEYTIPSIPCKIRGKRVYTAPVKFTVKRAPQVEIDGNSDRTIDAEIFCDDRVRRQNFYVGEQIKIHLDFAFLMEYTLQELPVVEAKVSPALKTPMRFFFTKQTRMSNANILVADSILYATAPGIYTIGANVSGKLEYKVGFFDSKTKRFRLTARPATVKILPLPRSPENAVVLRPLTENPRMHFRSIPPECNCGEPVTVALDLQVGKGDLNGVSVDSLHLPDCRDFPVEIKSQDKTSCQILFTFIPNKAGDLQIDKTFAMFDVLSGEYKTVTMKETIRVKPVQSGSSAPSAPSHSAPLGASLSRHSPSGAVADGPKASLKPISKVRVARAVKRHDRSAFGTLPLCLFILACGVVSATGILLFRNWKVISSKFQLTKAESARAKAMRALKKKPARGLNEDDMRALMEALTARETSSSRQHGSDEHDSVLRSLAKTDPELAESIQALSANVWMPESAKRSFDKAFYRKLIKSLGKILLFAVAFLIPLCGYATISTDAQIREAYDQGDYECCIELLEAHNAATQDGECSPDFLYCLGTCHAALESPPHDARALVALEKAHKLAPRDADILHNLNVVRSRLNMPEKYSYGSFSGCMARVASYFTMDELLIAMALAIALLLVVLVLKHRLTKFIAIPILCLVLLFSGFAVCLKKFVFAPAENAIVVQDSIVYQLPLPMKNSEEKTIGKLSAGKFVRIIEIREQRTRIQGDEVSGWIPTSHFQQF